MQIVIELSESDYEDVKKHPGSYNFGEAIKNGVVLPKGHGRLIDADAVMRELSVVSSRPVKSQMYMIKQAPTIIEADVTDINVGKKEE